MKLSEYFKRFKLKKKFKKSGENVELIKYVGNSEKKVKIKNITTKFIDDEALESLLEQIKFNWHYTILPNGPQMDLETFFDKDHPFYKWADDLSKNSEIEPSKYPRYYFKKIWDKKENSLYKSGDNIFIDIINMDLSIDINEYDYVEIFKIVANGKSNTDIVCYIGLRLNKIGIDDQLNILVDLLF